jgi:hypothetical protein
MYLQRGSLFIIPLQWFSTCLPFDLNFDRQFRWWKCPCSKLGRLRCEVNADRQCRSSVSSTSSHLAWCFIIVTSCTWRVFLAAKTVFDCCIRRRLRSRLHRQVEPTSIWIRVAATSDRREARRTHREKQTRIQHGFDLRPTAAVCSLGHGSTHAHAVSIRRHLHRQIRTRQTSIEVPRHASTDSRWFKAGLQLHWHWADMLFSGVKLALVS